MANGGPLEGDCADLLLLSLCDAVKDTPRWLTWPGVAVGCLLTIWGLLQGHERIPLRRPGCLLLAASELSQTRFYISGENQMSCRDLQLSLISGCMTPQNCDESTFSNSHRQKTPKPHFICHRAYICGDRHSRRNLCREIPIEGDGIPLNRYVFLYCEIGIAAKTTIFRVLADSKEVARRSLDFPIEFGRESQNGNK